MPFSAGSLGKLDGVLPETLAGAQALEQYANGLGIDLTIPDYGGFRTYAQQAQLVAWRDESVAKGGAFYAVAPAGSSDHEQGTAFDVQVVSVPSGMTSDQAYQTLADYAPQLGLTAGYYFGGGPPSKKSDPFHFQLASEPAGGVIATQSVIVDSSDDDGAGEPWLTVPDASSVPLPSPAGSEAGLFIALAITAILVAATLGRNP